MRPQVQMLCHVGPDIQGLSPYGDSLAAALVAHGQVALEQVGYRAAYPAALHPSAGARPGASGVHWASPASWRRVAAAPAQVLHIQHWMAPLAAYLLPIARMARRRGKRVVITVHNPEPHEAMPGTRWLEDALLASADVLVVHDARGRDTLARRLGPDADIRVIPHGIAAAAAPEPPRGGDPALLGLPGDRRYLCLFGNLRGYKGVPTLLEAWSRLLAEHPEVDLVIAGRLWTGGRSAVAGWVARRLGSRGEAEQIRRWLSLPEMAGRVHLREGFQPDETIDALLRVAGLAVFPYLRFASQSGAASRAAGLGCPVLVSDVGGLPGLAIGPDWVLPPGDVAALARAIGERLSRPDALQAARAAQLERVRPYRWEDVAAAHAHLYLEAASPRR